MEDSDPLSASSDGDNHEFLAHRVWYLYVSLLVLVTSHVFMSFPFPNRSWEVLTTLDFEWSFITRQRRHHRWTMWVRDDTTSRVFEFP